MSNNKIVTTFTTKRGRPAQIRYARRKDAGDLKNFINIFSLEDKFTRFSGEQLTLEEEEEYLKSEIAQMEAGDVVKLFCYIDQQLAGVCDIHRDTSLLTRKRHVGILGLIVAKDFRGEGVGEKLILNTISETKKNISGIRMVKLNCFAVNKPALSLYKKVGFLEVGRIPQSILYKGEYVDEVVMVKKI